MGSFETLCGFLRRNEQPVGGSGLPTEPHKSRSVDTALTIEAARLVVTTRAATKALLMRQLYVSETAAEQLLERLQHCKVIAPTSGNRPHRVITTSAELPRVVEEFTRRDGAHKEA